MQRSNTQVDPELQTEPVSQKSGQMQRNSNQNLKERVDGNFEFGISNVGPISAGSQTKSYFDDDSQESLDTSVLCGGIPRRSYMSLLCFIVSSSR